MADLLSLLLLLLAAGGFLIGGLVLRTESGGRWAMGWALLAMAGLGVALSEHSPAFRLASYVFGSLFPFAVVAGALRYAGRREPPWLIGAALVLAALRVSLAAADRAEASAALALMVDPSAVLFAAWLVERAARGRPAAHRLLAPGFVLLAAVEAYDGYLQIGAGNVATAPWTLWILASVPLAALQVVAGLRTTQVSSARAEQAQRESEAQLRDAQRVARLGSFRWRRGSASTTCSEETLRLLGVAGGPEVANEVLFATMSHEHLVRTQEVYKNALRAKEPFETEAQVMLNGALRLLQVRIEPSFAPSGELLGISGTVRDVTEARRAEEALRKSEERLRAILSSLGKTRVVVLDRSGRVFEGYGESGPEQRYGLAAHAFIGSDADAYLPAEDHEQSARVYSEVFATGEARELRSRVELPNGSFWFDISVSPLRDPSGAVGEVLIVARDVTEQLKAEEDRRQVEERMVQVQRLDGLGVLAGGIAHDFNNLLVGILGNAELALSEVERDSPAFELIHDMKSASVRAAGLTRQLLAYAGRTVVSPRPLDLAALVAENLPLLHTSFQAGVKLHVEAAGPGPWVDADDAQIGQVVLNLLSNAAEAVGEQGGEIRVRTSLLHADERMLSACIVSDGLSPGDFACLEISDTGCGIPSEVMPRIFDPFFTTKFTGRGLGLAAVLGIVRSHGGTIRVESEAGSGSRFQVLLPATAAQVTAVGSEPASASAPSSRSAKLLVVDDEPMVLSMAARMLRSRGFEVLEAASASRALELFAAGKDDIDAALLDLTMPDTDGIELLDALRQLRQDLPVVLMSGHSPEDALERVAGRSRTACLPKPFGLSALVAVIDRVLEQRAGSAEQDPSQR